MQASGEAATGSQQTTFDSMNLFIGVMTDPFMAGRSGNTTGAVPFADESGSSDAYAAAGRKRTGGEREAYGMMTKAAPHVPGFGSRWDAWAAGFGGGQTSDGNAALGSQHDNQPDRRVRRGCRLRAVAADCGRFRPGRRRHQLLRRQWFGKRTVRSVSGRRIPASLLRRPPRQRSLTVGRTSLPIAGEIAGIDRLHAQFNANAFSGRIESGYRLVAGWMGFTPYAAAQFTTFNLPAHTEQVLSGANTFALAYNAKGVTASRSEFGVRTDSPGPCRAPS